LFKLLEPDQIDEPMKILAKLVSAIDGSREGQVPVRNSSDLYKIFYALKVGLKLQERVIMHIVPYPAALLNNTFVDKLRNLAPHD
jgi:hypothetical protein